MRCSTSFRCRFSSTSSDAKWSASRIPLLETTRRPFFGWSKARRERFTRMCGSSETDQVLPNKALQRLIARR
jgi:hypothetical protein